jgi:hypothetical protein
VQPAEGLLIQVYLLQVTGLGWGTLQLSMAYPDPSGSEVSLRSRHGTSHQGSPPLLTLSQ